MLTQIDVVSENAFTLPVLGVTTKAPLLIRKITGLNPPDRDLFMGDYARDGGIYQGSRVGVRNVVFTIDLNPDPALGQTVSSLRNDLYMAFMDPLVESDALKFVLHDDSLGQVYTYGYTEKFETDIFDVETTLQISVVCPDPFLRDDYKTVTSNPQGLITIPFTYSGSSETGFEAEVFIDNVTSTLILDNNSITNDVLSPNYYRGRMIINYPFSAGDVVYFNTTRGQRNVMRASKLALPSAWSAATAYVAGSNVSYNNKYWTARVSNTNVPPGAIGDDKWFEQDVTDRWASLERQGLTTPLLGKLDATSRWLELHSQNNKLRVYGPNGVDDVRASIRTLAYTQAYWGV